MTASELARQLHTRKTGTGWSAKCPAHDDREPSLSISQAADGKVLVKCHAGCEQEAVVEALKTRGLWDVPASHILVSHVYLSANIRLMIATVNTDGSVVFPKLLQK